MVTPEVCWSRAVAGAAGPITGDVLLAERALALPSVVQAGDQRGRRRGPLADIGGSASLTALLDFAGPVSNDAVMNDAVTLAFREHIGAIDAPRTGTCR